MTDRFKGFLVTLDKEIREDDAEHIVNALKMIKGVFLVKPYINEAEDWMMYEKGVWDTKRKLIEFMDKELEQPKE